MVCWRWKAKPCRFFQNEDMCLMKVVYMQHKGLMGVLQVVLQQTHCLVKIHINQ